MTSASFLKYLGVILLRSLQLQVIQLIGERILVLLGSQVIKRSDAGLQVRAELSCATNRKRELTLLTCTLGSTSKSETNDVRGRVE